MDAVIEKIIEQLNSSVFVLLVVLVAIGVLLWKVSGFMATWKYKQADHEERLRQTDSVKEKVAALEANTGKAVDFGERIVRMETKLDLIFQKLSPNPFAKSQSPIALTDEGRQTADKVNVIGTVNRLYPNLRELVGNKSPKTAYDIQECAFAVAREKLFGMLSESELIDLKNEAFNRGMPMDSFTIIYGIVLRDKILNEQGMVAEDVDKHAP